MGQVTILNGINVPVNSCISAVINLSWCNKLSPKTYYQHNGAASVVTLNVNYWFGEETEFSSDPGTVITTILGTATAGAGVALAVAGLALEAISGGTSTALVVAGASLAVSGVGAVVSAVSMAVNEFNNEPCKWTAIQALQNRKFIVEGADASGNTGIMVTLTQDTAPDGTATINYTNPPVLHLRELQDGEFQALINNGGYTEHQAQPLAGEYLTVSELGKLNLTNVNVKISPALGGNCCWEIENDQTNEGAPLQIWERDVPQVYWMLVPANSTDNTTNTFYLYNPVLSRYATSGQSIGANVSASSGQSAAQQFRIMRSEESDQFSAQPYFAFIPVQTQNCAVICQNGNLGNSTKLLLGPTTSVNPMWALWKVTPVNA